MSHDVARATLTGSTLPLLPQTIALAGNPNAGKTTVFNALTGMRQKVANYPGVTVEKKTGRCITPSGRTVDLVDLPGCYSLDSRSPDEDVVRDILLGLRADMPRPEMVIVVLDASNLDRNLYLATQILELGLPVVLALNMIDVADARGRAINTELLQQRLGVPVVAITARRGVGLDELRRWLDASPPAPTAATPFRGPFADELQTLTTTLCELYDFGPARARATALRLLGAPRLADTLERRFGASCRSQVDAALSRLREANVEPTSHEAMMRYAWIEELLADVVRAPAHEPLTLTERVDRLLTHRVFGPIIFLLLMAFVFQSIYTWAAIPMDLIDGGVQWLSGALKSVLPAGFLTSLLTDGVLSGVGAVLVFLPQILLLFLFLAILDDTGYLARAAFMMDRLLSVVGLHGRSFIPLMGCFACAIPGIMATRTIESRRDRLLTILIAPLMSCSARLPVYALLIGAFIPDRAVWGGLRMQGLTLLAMYVLGIAVAMVCGMVFRRTIFRGQPAPYLMELPPYRAPVLRNALIAMWERSREFVHRAGTIILAISVLLWFLMFFPQATPLPHETPADTVSRQIQQSYAGRLGHLIEPVVRPLGFDWRIGIGLIGSFAAREVLVSTLATVYNVADGGDDAVSLREAMKRDRYPDGRPVFTSLVAVSLMVFFVLACQCMSTLAIVRRETNSWTWPLFLFSYMTALAYTASLVTYQVGRVLGFG